MPAFLVFEPVFIQKIQMSEIRARLIELATRLFGENREQRLGAERWLEDQVAGTDEGSFREVISRWEELDAKKRPRLWRRFFLAACLLVSAVAMVPFEGMIKSTRQTLLTLKDGNIGRGEPRERIGEGLDQEAQLLLGDQRHSVVKQKADLWDSDRENPAYFAECAVAFQQARGALPPGYFEIADRIDPDNAWFDYFAAGSLADGAVAKLPMTKEEKLAKTVPEWKIIRPDRFAEVLAILHRARSKSRYESYAEALLRRRIPLLPQRTKAEALTSLAYVIRPTTPETKLMKLSEVIAAQAWVTGEAGDAGTFRDLLVDSQAFIGTLLRSEDCSMLGELSLIASLSIVTRNLQDASVKLGVAEENPQVAELLKKSDRYADERQERKKRGKLSRSPDLLGSKGSILSSLAVPVLSSSLKAPPEITEADLKPGRLSDHHEFAMISSGIVWLLLAIAAGAVFVFRFRASASVRILAKRLESLLRPTDWAWIVVAGIGLPFGLVIGISLFTPLGGRESSIQMSIGASGLFLPMAHFAAMTELLIIVPVLVARWRLARRGKAFGIRAAAFLGWSAVALLVAFVIHFSDLNRWLQIGLLTLPAFWILGVAGKALFTNSNHLLWRVVMSRVLLVAYAAGTLCLVVAVFGFRNAHQYWFERDEFMKLSADEPGINRQEYRFARQLHRETRDAMR